jgi:hypothetical protein
MIKNLLIVLFFMIIFVGCKSPSEPNNLNAPRLILSADKTEGNSPLNVKLSVMIAGNTEGLTGHVPDYVLLAPSWMTIVIRTTPDTAQSLKTFWDKDTTFTTGEWKLYLCYLGIKDGIDFILYSDTLSIKVY